MLVQYAAPTYVKLRRTPSYSNLTPLYLHDIIDHNKHKSIKSKLIHQKNF